MKKVPKKTAGRPVFFYFLWENRDKALLAFLFSLIFAVIFYLYRLPGEALLYALLLLAAVGLLWTGLAFWRYQRRWKERRRLLSYAATAPLPAGTGRSLAEKDYFAVVEELRRSMAALTERAEREKTESNDYYGMWIHQIKTPMAAMELMLQEEDTPEHRALQAELFRIEQYAEMALWYLRMEDGSDLLIRPVALNEVIKDAVHKYAPLFVRKKIRLVCEPTEETALTDRKWLTFLLEQLLSNSVKYTLQGEVRIGVAQGILTVSDTGIGIAKEDLPRIFEKGYTGYNGHEERRSTGIGLYLCKKAADRLSHTLSVTSAVGVGSCFSVNLNQASLRLE